MPSSEAAYVAGLFEGEGTTGHYKNRKRSKTTGEWVKDGSQTVAKLFMTDREPLDRVVEITGMGRVTGPHTRQGNRKDVYVWGVWNAIEVQRLACLIWDWLSPRRQEQFAKALAGWAARHA